MLDLASVNQTYVRTYERKEHLSPAIYVAELMQFLYNDLVLNVNYVHTICNSYNMDARALAYLLHEGAKRPRAINELSA